MKTGKAAVILALVLGLASFRAASADAQKKKILYVDSYHIEYMWSSDIIKGVRSVLNSRDDVELKITFMDTKRNMSEGFKKSAALSVKELIESWKPDIVIAADDNASKYLIVPYYRGADLPFVFCGVNWDAGVYGFPARNVTGMVEVSLLTQTINILKKYSTGQRIGLIASDTLSERKHLENLKKNFGIDFKARFVKTFEELKKEFVKLQEECDLMLVLECRSVQGFNHEEMSEFVGNNTNIPTGAMQRYLIHYAMLTYSKIGEEQGEWAANTALEILGGRSPADIPIAANKKAKVYLNMPVAKRLGVKFPMELIERATFVEETMP